MAPGSSARAALQLGIGRLHWFLLSIAWVSALCIWATADHCRVWCERAEAACCSFTRLRSQIIDCDAAEALKKRCNIILEALHVARQMKARFVVLMHFSMTHSPIRSSYSWFVDVVADQQRQQTRRRRQRRRAPTGREVATSSATWTDSRMNR